MTHQRARSIAKLLGLAHVLLPKIGCGYLPRPRFDLRLIPKFKSVRSLTGVSPLKHVR